MNMFKYLWDYLFFSDPLFKQAINQSFFYLVVTVAVTGIFVKNVYYVDMFFLCYSVLDNQHHNFQGYYLLLLRRIAQDMQIFHISYKS